MRTKQAVRALISNKPQPIEMLSGDRALSKVNKLANLGLEIEL